MALSAVSKRRLTKLADFLDGLRLSKSRRFDLTEWGNKTECSTAACAVGWATTIPSFRKAGFKTKQLEYSPESEGRFCPTYRSHSGFKAACEFFGLDRRQVDYLFTTEGYKQPTKSAVVRRIRAFVKSEGTKTYELFS